MDRLGRILGARQDGDWGAIQAAALLDQANHVLYEHLQVDTGLARASRFRAGELLVEVTNGALAISIRQQQSQIIKHINVALGNPPGTQQRGMVQRLAIRIISPRP